MRSIVYTNDNCIGCNKCINVCSAIGACISTERDGKPRIEVDGTKCVACGSCMDVCVHNAREFEDDTDRFFEDLEKGEQISLLLAPAFKANYPDEYDSVLGGLKKLGVNRIISVAFGADICTWGYLTYIKQNNFYGGISQPCPAVVSYIERYLPELLPKLFPVQSPLMCAAIYARKQLGITDRFAFISPCIAKKMEIEDPNNEGLVQYNVTFEHLMRHIREKNITGESARSEIEYGLGSFYPTPGGLAENVKWFLGDSVYIRQIEGERRLYNWMHHNRDRIRNNKTPFLFVDALNCDKGCICGTAVDPVKSETDDALYALLDIREESKKKQSGDAWSKCDTPEERLKHFNEQFADLKIEDYLRGYTDRSSSCSYLIPDEEALNAIFISMNKLTEESRQINCTCCGYESCLQMATAIFNGFNHRENCIYYERTMVHELEVEKAIAEEATLAKSAFLANMSHEIRTPINAVLGMNEMILRECEDENVIAYSERIRSAGSTLLGLVNNILDFSKIEAGKMEITPVDYDLSSVLNDLVNMIQTRADEKGLLLYLDFDPAMPKLLHGDELRIKQIIMNLLTNAVKYTEQGSITFKMCFEKTESDKEVIIKTTVTDTGIGIKKEDIARLFEQFKRIEEKRNRNIEGTGLGMNITQKLLEMMNSTLEVESEYGKGSSFSFELKQPVVKWEELGNFTERYQKAKGERTAYHERFTAPEADILVIDDNPMNLIVFKSLLKQTKVRIDTANDGDEGIAFALKKKYDIIFFDHMMPGKDGIETLNELRSHKDNPNILTPSICLTANAVSGARETYIAAGFDDYLTKPIESAKLEEMIASLLPPEKIVSVSAVRAEETEKSDLDDVRLAPMKTIAEIDLEEGIKNSGSVDAYLPLLKIFYESIDDKADEIEGFYKERNIKDYTIKVHALKSSARLIGATLFAEIAQALETAGKDGNEAFIDEHTEPFMKSYRNFKELLKCMFTADADDADKPEADAEMMEGVYDEIRSSAECMDCDALEVIFGEMENYRIPDADRDLFAKMKAAARIFDYDAILKLIEEKG